jgi:hypothetical protein
MERCDRSIEDWSRRVLTAKPEARALVEGPGLFDPVTGAVLVAFGVRLAVEPE